ncbi:hypothetical protein PoB_007253400 [Plakobranchus ocellatus]|uniref:Uncharacterized protein n=1 Tax=Plakobranchus ocellatus TaxID=259542 RepID=A0AAV4DP86_9GAST|nr:hypothetical protein PoB_007253400 [Plakobranchus ocellatus]
MTIKNQDLMVPMYSKKARAKYLTVLYDNKEPGSDGSYVFKESKMTIKNQDLMVPMYSKKARAKYLTVLYDNENQDLMVPMYSENGNAVFFLYYMRFD